jgi:hypothetical protein
MTPVHPLRSYQQHECGGGGHTGGGHGLITGGGHGLITGGGHGLMTGGGGHTGGGLHTGGGTGLQTGGGHGLQQFVTTTGAHGTHAEASDTLASVAPTAINASNVLMINPFFYFPVSVFVWRPSVAATHAH